MNLIAADIIECDENLHLCKQVCNECTGVQNPHRYMHAYSMAHSVHVQYQEYIELHTLHLNRVLVYY